MDDDYVITPDFSRRATVRSIAPPPPRAAQTQPPAPVATRLQAPSLTPSIPRYETPIANTGPSFEYVSPLAASQGPSLASATLGDPTISSTINYSPHLETNYSQNASYYLKQGQGGGDPADWYLYPTQNGSIIFPGVSGEELLTGSGGELFYAGTSVMPYTWYEYPALSGRVQFDSSTGLHDLQAVGDDLYYDGDLLARAGDIQDIAAWSDYPMIHPIVGNGFSIGGVLDVSASGAITGASATVTGDISGATLHISGAAAVGSLSSVGDISGATLNISGAAAVGSLSSVGDISGATLHISGTATIHDIDLSGCALTSNAGGTALYVNGVLVQTGSPADVSQWATFPAVANVDVGANGLSMTGSLAPPATNKFGIGTALAPIGINDQYAFSTNIYNMSPVGTMNISSNASMAILTTSTTGTNEMNISLVGAAGEDMNLTAPDLNLTMTDPASFMNLTAPFGVAVLGGGGFFMASGVMEVITGLDISLITPGNIRIGSGNVGGATTQVEKFEFLDEFLSPMNGVNHLRLQNIEVINTPKDAGGDGYFPGVFNVAAAISSTFTLTSVNISSEKMLWQVQTDQGSSVYKSMNLISQGTGGVNFSMSAVTGTKMNMGYDGNTLTIDRPTSITANMGSSSITTGQISATGNISTPLDISGGTMHTGTLTATVDVSGASGHFGPLYSDSTEIHLGTATSTIGTNCVFIGNKAGQNLLSPYNGSIAIGEEAGEQLTGDDTICLGFQAGSRCDGGDNICIGYNSGVTSLAQSVSIGAYAGGNGGLNNVSIGAFANTNPTARYGNTLVLNATGAALNATAANSFYVNPIADLSGGTGFNMLGHNSATGEIRRGTATLTEAQNTISNTQQISYDTGLLTTTINGITSLQTVKAAGPATIGTPTALSTLTVAGTMALQDASSNTVTIQKSAGAASWTLTLPPNDGDANQVLQTNGSGVSTWVSAATAAGLIGAANTFYVAENGVDVSGGGQVYAPFRTIQFAINSCTAGAQDNGQTIFLYPGLYVENLTIADKNINFRGSGDTQHTYNTTIRGNMTITSSNTNRSYRTVSFQFLQIQNYTASTGTAITLSTTGTGKGKLVLTGCYVIGAATGVRLLDATAANCDWIIICDTTRFYTGLAYSQPLLDLSGNNGTAPSLTLNQCVVEYESPAGSTNSLVKVGGYSAFTSQYSTITQPLNATFNNSALTNGLVWLANTLNAASSNVTTIGTTLFFSGTQVTLGVAGTVGIYCNRGCPALYILTGTFSVRSNSTPATHCIVGAAGAGTRTTVYYLTGNLITTAGTANKIDNTNCLPTNLVAVS